MVESFFQFSLSTKNFTYTIATGPLKKSIESIDLFLLTLLLQAFRTDVLKRKVTQIHTISLLLKAVTEKRTVAGLDIIANDSAHLLHPVNFRITFITS